MFDARILVVDDNLMDARLCQLLLGRHSFEVLVTTDPRTALELLQQQTIHLLLVDIYLPHIDGFELIAQAKKIQPDMAVLVMTGFASVDIGIQALQRGVDGLILKPFENGERLIDAVQQALVQNRNKQDAARLQVLRPLFSVTEGLISETKPEALNELILTAAESLFPNSRICFLRKTGEQGDFRLVSSSQGSGICMKLEFMRFLKELIHKTGTAFITTADNPEFLPWRAELEKARMWSFMFVPVHQGSNWFIFLASRSPDVPAFRTSDLEMFILLARQAAIAEINANLYEELRDTLKRVEESQRALVQAEKMAVVGRLIASVAHEINNPLQAIGNCLHLAERPDLAAEQRADYLRLGKTELDRLIATVRRMLDFYRSGVETREPVDVPELIEHVLDLLHTQLHENGIAVEKKFHKSLPVIMGTENQLQQVLLNLMLNAVDSLSCADGMKVIWIEARVENDQLHLYIEDSGQGIHDTIKPRIFEPFFSTKPDGMGLGLMVSYGIVEAHGGTIQLVTPQHASGANFLVRLPYGV